MGHFIWRNPNRINGPTEVKDIKTLANLIRNVIMEGTKDINYLSYIALGAFYATMVCQINELLTPTEHRR